MTNTAFSSKSQSINSVHFWSAISPLHYGKPQRARSVYERASSFLSGRNTQHSAVDKQPSGLFLKTKHTSKGSALQAQELSPLLPFPFWGPSKASAKTAVLQNVEAAHASGSGYSFPCHPFMNHTATTHILASTSGPCICHMLLHIWPLLYFLWLSILLGLVGWRGESRSIFLRGRETMYFSLFFFFGNLYFGPFPALPSTLHVCI